MALVRNLRKGESLTIGDNILIKIGDNSRIPDNGRVILVVDAPREIPIKPGDARILDHQEESFRDED